MLTFWIRPAAAVLFWIAVAATTLAELTTVRPSLQAAAGVVEPVAAHRSRPALAASAGRWHR